MARVAEFAQFSDSQIDLRIGGDIDRTLTKNLDATPASGHGALLSWMTRREATGSVTYEVKVNGTVITPSGGLTVTVADWVGVHEALSTDDIHLGNNTVEFRVTGGTATLSFSDVILFYRQDT
jgi:hypothetical protein